MIKVWGVSEADVRKAYNIGNEIPAVPSKDDPNITIITQENVSGNIASRMFLFNGGKLYRVAVNYKGTSEGTRMNLQSVIENKYGQQTDSDSETGQTSSGFRQVPYTIEKYIYGKYSPDLVVELAQIVVHDVIEGKTFFVYYTWKKFYDEYQASKLGL